MTYSLESAFVRAYSTAAVAAQGLCDKFATFERITRPPRQQWADLDTPLDGAEQQRPCDTGDCYHDAHGLVCPFHCFDQDDTPNPTEPGLSDDELVGVRGLLQERYEDAWDRDGRCVFCGATREYVAATGGCVGPLCPNKDSAATTETSAAVSGEAVSEFACVCGTRWTGAAYQCPECGAEAVCATAVAAAGGPTVPAELKTAGSSGEAVSAQCPRPDPASPRPDLADWLEPAVMTSLEPHEPRYGLGIVTCCGEPWPDWQAWREHVAPDITSRVAQALRDYPGEVRR